MTIAQRIVKEKNKHNKIIQYKEMCNRGICRECNELQSNAKLYARALNEELKRWKNCPFLMKSKTIIHITEQVSFIESELKLLKEAKLI